MRLSGYNGVHSTTEVAVRTSHAAKVTGLLIVTPFVGHLVFSEEM
jgi:hypothetical protein